MNKAMISYLNIHYSIGFFLSYLRFKTMFLTPYTSNYQLIIKTALKAINTPFLQFLSLSSIGYNNISRQVFSVELPMSLSYTYFCQQPDPKQDHKGGENGSV